MKKTASVWLLLLLILILGALLFHESITLPQGLCVALIAAGIVGLKLLS